MLSWLPMTKASDHIANAIEEVYKRRNPYPQYLSKIWKTEYGMEIDE